MDLLEGLFSLFLVFPGGWGWGWRAGQKTRKILEVYTVPAVSLFHGHGMEVSVSAFVFVWSGLGVLSFLRGDLLIFGSVFRSRLSIYV